jgi:hypothetical protein
MALSQVMRNNRSIVCGVFISAAPESFVRGIIEVACVYCYKIFLIKGRSMARNQYNGCPWRRVARAKWALGVSLV